MEENNEVMNEVVTNEVEDSYNAPLTMDSYDYIPEKKQLTGFGKTVVAGAIGLTAFGIYKAVKWLKNRKNQQNGVKEDYDDEIEAEFVETDEDVVEAPEIPSVEEVND